LPFTLVNGNIDISLKSEDGKEYVLVNLTANPGLVRAGAEPWTENHSGAANWTRINRQ